MHLAPACQPSSARGSTMGLDSYGARAGAAPPTEPARLPLPHAHKAHRATQPPNKTQSKSRSGLNCGINSPSATGGSLKKGLGNVGRLPICCPHPVIPL